MTDIAVSMEWMPECWQDDKRMNSLFAPFRKKESNPVDWESKMKFWKSAVEKWCFENNDCIMSVKKMEKEFRRKERTPQCLATVIETLARNGDVKKKADVLKGVGGEETWTGWAVNSLVKAPVVWSFTKLKDALLETDITETEFVHVNFLKVKSEMLLTAVNSKKETLLTLEQVEKVMTEEGKREMGAETVRLVVAWLQGHKAATVSAFEGKTLVKFTSDKNKAAGAISEADTAAFTLEQSRAALLKNLESLELQKQQALDETKEYLRKGLRQSAKSCLRKKKELEKCIEKRGSALDNTEILLSRIREAESDAKVLEAYKTGLSALKTTFKNAGLSEDSVIHTMTEVQEVIEVHDEIQTALSEPAEPVFNQELEDELAALIKTDSEEKTFLSELPDVPTSFVDRKAPEKERKLLPS